MPEASSPRSSATRRRPPARRSAAARRRLVLLVGAVVLLALVVVGVAVASKGGGESASDTVTRAFEPGGDLKTAHVNVKLGLSGSAAADGEPLAIGIDGPYKAGNAKTARFRFDVALGGATGTDAPAIALLGVGGKTYVQVANQSFVLAADAVDGLKSDGAKKDAGLSFSSLGVDPRSWLTDPKKVGDEQLGGESVTHVRAGVDTGRLGTDLEKVLNRADKASGSAKETQAATAALGNLRKGITSTRMDVWAAKGKGALRRLKVDLQLDKGRILMDLTLGSINEPVSIKAPKSALPFEQLLSALNADSSASGSGEAASGSGSSTASDAYATCVSDAGGDVAKLQECAKLAD